MIAGDRRKLLFVVGCQRSGTTWVQLLLAQHPAIATHNETFLFVYLDEMRSRWTNEPMHFRHRHVGLTRLLSGKEFDDLCRDFASGVLDKIRRSRPEAAVVLEKTPDHILHGETILALFPDAHVLHVVRDPRSVVASLLAASRLDWGQNWAPKGIRAAAETWREAIEASRTLAAKAIHYHEVRYEALMADTAKEVSAIFSWLGEPCSPDFVERAVAACRIENLKTISVPVSAPWNVAAEPAGFFRRGEIEGWRTDLTPSQVRKVEYYLVDLMREWGYAPVSGHLDVKPLDVRARDAVAAVRWLLRRWRD